MKDRKPIPELTPEQYELYEAIHRMPWTAKQAHAAFAAVKRKPQRRKWRHPDQEPHPWA